MIKLSTLIKSFKIAISNIYEKTEKWEHVYLGDIIFPGEDDNPDDRITLMFSSTPDMQPGSIGISISMNVYSIDKLEGGMNYISSSEFINSDCEINEVSNLIIVLGNLIETLSSIDSSYINNIKIKSVRFNFDDRNISLDTDMFDSTIIASERLVLLGI